MKYKLELDRFTAICAYRRGKLIGVEIKKGAFDIVALAKWVPMLETNIDSRLMQPAEKSKAEKNGIFKVATIHWNAFYNKTTGLDYRWTAADGVSLTRILKYLGTICENDNHALELWQIILNNWHQLDEFYRKNPDLKFINGQLNKIIYQLKHGKNGVTSNSDHADDLRRSFTR